MSNTEQQVEQEIQSKNLNAPRITPEHIGSVIVSEHYFTAAQGDAKAIEDWAFVNGSLNGAAMRPVPKALELLTFCVLVLKNGFTVTGESACASPENFDPEIGKRIAYDNARNKIWPLEGYLLKEKLHIKVGEHEASDIKYSQPAEDKKCEDGVKPFEPSCSSQVGCVDGNTDKSKSDRENSYLLTHLLGSTLSPELRRKAEEKLILLIDRLITE